MEKIYLSIKFGDNQTAKGYVLDVSKSGMGIASDKMIKENEVVEIILKGSLPISLKAQVLSVSVRDIKPYSYRLGVKFTVFTEDSKKKLTDFIINRERRRSGRFVLLRLWKQD